MPQTQLSSKLGSSNSVFDVKEEAKVKRSKFDFGMKNLTNIDIGGIYPIDFFQVFPNDDITLNVDYLLDTLPLAVPPMNNYRVRTHWYYCKMSALWKGWESFVTKGRSGTVDLQVPTISGEALDREYTCDGLSCRLSVPMGLSTFLGLPAKYVSDQTSSSDPIFLPYVSKGIRTLATNRITQGYSVLPFLMYQKIYRHNYAPIDLLQDNKIWFPDDLCEEWRIDYDGTNLKGALFIPKGNISDVIGDSDVGTFDTHFVPSVEDKVVNLLQLRYACFENDYFTKSKPWLVRGEETTIQSTLKFAFDKSDLVVPPGTPFGTYDTTLSTPYSIPDSYVPGYGVAQGHFTPVEAAKGKFALGFSVSGRNVTATASPANSFLNLLSSVPASSTLTANTLRNLIALSVYDERNAVAAGNYNSFTRAHWGTSPHSPDYEPLYLGGTSDVVSFGQVLQTSQSTDNSPLGTRAGLGSASGRSNVFHFSCRDFGFIMGVIIVSPEVVYEQGVGHEFTDIHQSDIYTPEFANLGFQPVLNREIFVTGDEGIDNGLFGYNARYSYLKQRRNRAGGLFSLPSDADKLFSAYVQSRQFAALPKLSAQFVSMSPNNVRRDFLSYTKQPAFNLQFASDVTLVRALPYQSTPNTFGF